MARITVNSPHTRRFLSAAVMHLEAAGVLLRAAARGAAESRLSTVTVYLSGYAVECGLKAWFLANTHPRNHATTIGVLFKGAVGHNLEELERQLARRRGLRLPPLAKAAFSRVRGQWSSEMRYDAERTAYSSAEHVHGGASELLNWLIED